MALIVESGSGSSTAESYASVADADAYLAARGQTLWAGMVTGDKEAALRRSTDYMQQAYRERWAGTRTNMTQALDWPRWNVPVKDVPGGYGSLPTYLAANVIPAEVKQACIALALKAAAGDLAPDIEPQTLSEKVGPIEVTYAEGGRQTVKYQAIDNMLSPYLVDGGSGAMVRITRA